MIASPYATRITRFGQSAGRDMSNRKPRRTRSQKAEARQLAKKVDGTFVCKEVPTHRNLPDEFHPNAAQIAHYNAWRRLGRG